MRASQSNMAVAQATKTKPASKASNNAASKQKSQMHRRSRTGSYYFAYSWFVPSPSLVGLQQCWSSYIVSSLFGRLAPVFILVFIFTFMS